MENHDQFHRINDVIRAELEGTGFTYGYIGNVWTTAHNERRDDRAWMIFKPVEGRVKTRDDTLGDFNTENRSKLLGYAKAVRAGYEHGRKLSPQVEQLIYNEMSELVLVIDEERPGIYADPQGELDQLKADYPEIWKRVNQAYFETLHDV